MNGPIRQQVHTTCPPLLDRAKLASPTLTLRRIQDLFQRTTGLDLCIWRVSCNAGQFQTQRPFDSPRLPQFCRLLRESARGNERCLACHQAMAKAAIERNCPFSQLCHAGLLTIHYPVSLSPSEPADLVTVCALGHGAMADPRPILNRVSDLPVPEGDLAESLRKLQVLSQRKIREVIDWLELIVDYLSESREGAIEELVHRQASPALLATPSRYSVEHQIRQEIGRRVALPPWRAGRNTGGSCVLVEHVTEFLKSCYHLSLSTQVMAQALGFQPGYFGKMFRQHAGESFVCRLKRIRLDQAQRLLQNPHVSVAEVASQSGFADPAYFSRQFKRSLNVRPSEFRDAHGANPGNTSAVSIQFNR